MCMAIISVQIHCLTQVRTLEQENRILYDACDRRGVLAGMRTIRAALSPAE